MKKCPCLRPVIRRCRAAGDQSGALVGPDFDVAADLVDGTGIDQRTNVGRRFEARAQAHARRAIDEPADQLVRDRFVHHQPAARGASLAGGAERRPQDALDGEIEVRVGHDRDRVLATQLELTRVSRRAGRVAMARPVSPLPVNADDVDVGVLDERHADFVARARDHVHDARREAGLVP